MLACAALGLLTVGCMADQEVTADQFARLASASLANYHDVAFLFEGRLASVLPGTTPEEAMAGKGAQTRGALYQGRYIYRADGAILIESTVNANFDILPTISWRSLGLLRGKLTKIESDRQGGREQISEGDASAGSLNEPYSPQRIVYPWLLRQLTDPTSWNYQFLGWDDIGGHRCLKVQLDQGQGWPSVPDRPVYRIWVDVARGGHPLRVEYVDKEGVRMRANAIELAEVPAGDGKAYWFPIRGRLEMFALDGGRYQTRVSGIESYYILDGTLKINQGVPDSDFDVKAKAAQARRAAGKTALPRGTPEGMKRGLEQNLEIAESQAKALRASASDDDPWHLSIAIPVGIGILGVAALAGAIWMRRNRA